jgi:hypothetical protein
LNESEVLPQPAIKTELLVMPAARKSRLSMKINAMGLGYIFTDT